MTWTHDIFDLTGWKLTLPVDEDYFDGSGDFTDGRAYEIKPAELEGFEANDIFFYDAEDGAMVFRADPDGARTSSNTNYTRTELREMDGDNRAAWTIEEGGTMSATLKVTQLSDELDPDREARVIVGQIHGQNDELMRLYYDEGGDLYYANERTGSDGDERLFFFENADGQRPNVDLGETFSYIVDVTDGKLIVEVYSDGQVYSAVPTDGIDPTEISSDWDGDTFYFKAGLYQGVSGIDGHSREGTGIAEARFYDLDFSHVPGEGREGWLGEADSAPETQDDAPPVIDTEDAPEPAPPEAPAPEPQPVEEEVNEPQPEPVLDEAPEPVMEEVVDPLPLPEPEPEPEPVPDEVTEPLPEPEPEIAEPIDRGPRAWWKQMMAKRNEDETASETSDGDPSLQEDGAPRGGRKIFEQFRARDESEVGQAESYTISPEDSAEGDFRLFSRLQQFSTSEPTDDLTEAGFGALRSRFRDREDDAETVSTDEADSTVFDAPLLSRFTAAEEITLDTVIPTFEADAAEMEARFPIDQESEDVFPFL